MDGVNESDENGKISNHLDLDVKKTHLWMKVVKVTKPQRRKWHFTQLRSKLTTISLQSIPTVSARTLKRTARG
ncbi:hypothetical protein Hanom_Chr15g01361441 [Helianthus anomalus]